MEHHRMVQHYRESKSGLQAQLEAGITFKKSTAKGASDLDFVPVNLHIQQLKVVSEETDFKGEGLQCSITVTSLEVLHNLYCIIIVFYNYDLNYIIV